MAVGLCSITGCGVEGNLRRGWCNKHYSRWYKQGEPHIVMRAGGKHKDPYANFWDKVDKTEGCWIWTAYRTPLGYGHYRYLGKARLAHRVVAQWLLGLDLDDRTAIVDHQCRNPSCVNPEHLRIGTHKENMENRIAQQGSLSGIRGVSWCEPMGKWRARTKHNGVEYLAGYFNDKESAGEAARELRLQLNTNNVQDRV